MGQSNATRLPAPVVGVKFITGILAMKILLTLFSFLSLIGCMSSSGYREKISHHKNIFFAKYYDGDELAASEWAERISINYSGDGFHKIKSTTFKAAWEKDIDGGKNGRYITMSFSQSWAKRLVYIDEKVISSWSGHNEPQSEFIDPGVHKIKIEYESKYHKINFNASFDDYPILTKSKLSEEFKNINTRTKVIYIDAIESDDINNRAIVLVPKSKNPIAIFLASDKGINWIIDNPNKTNVSHIITSYGSGSSITNNQENTKTYTLFGFYAYHDPKHYDGTANDIKNITGLDVNYRHGEYIVSEVKIPEGL